MASPICVRYLLRRGGRMLSTLARASVSIHNRSSMESSINPPLNTRKKSLKHNCGYFFDPLSYTQSPWHEDWCYIISNVIVCHNFTNDKWGNYYQGIYKQLKMNYKYLYFILYCNDSQFNFKYIKFIFRYL